MCLDTFFKRYTDLAILCLALSFVAACTPDETTSPLKELDHLTYFQQCENCPRMIILPDTPPGVGAIAVSQTEITVAQYRAFVVATGHKGKSNCRSYRGGYWYTGESNGKNWERPGVPTSNQHPVVCISWQDAKAYTAWLSKVTGGKYRLLTEAEWEFSASADQHHKYWFGNDESQLCEYGNFRDKAYGNKMANCSDHENSTAKVGSYLPNPYGLYDTIGNVAEWVEDCWRENSLDDSTAANSASCSQRVVKGGSWFERAALQETKFRSHAGPGLRNFHIGFRVLREMSDQPTAWIPVRTQDS